MAYLPETLRSRRGHDFYPSEEDRAAIPDLCGDDLTEVRAKVIWLHYFTAGADWWLSELGRGDEAAGLAFGYANLGDPQNAEWGTVHLPELEALEIAAGLIIVERDLYWTPTAFGDIRHPSLAHLEL